MRNPFGFLKARSSLPQGGQWSYRLPVPVDNDLRNKMGDGMTHELVLSLIFWLARTFPEAKVRLQRTNGIEHQPVPVHPFLSLLKRPNGAYSGVTLWMASMASWVVNGNVYWRKMRSPAGRVVALWFIPHWMIEPKWDSPDRYIDYYEYTPGGSVREKIPPEDIVHFRFGLDPENTRKGLSQIASAFRELFTDEEAARFTAALLKNMGVPGVVVSPTGDNTISPDDADAMKILIMQKTAGAHRGEPLVTTGPVTLQQFGFSPSELSLDIVRKIPEERLSALIGIPAVVVGFGAGLDRSTFNNMTEAREMAYESNVIPSYRIFAADLENQLLTDFVDDLDAWEVDFDTTLVRVLQEDQNALATRVVTLVGGPVFTRAEGRQMLGLEFDEADEVYLLPMSTVEVQQGVTIEERQAVEDERNQALVEQQAQLAGPADDDGGDNAPPPPGNEAQ